MVTLQAHSGPSAIPAFGRPNAARGRSRRRRPGAGPLLDRFAANPKLLHLTGLVRMHQQRIRRLPAFSPAPGPPNRARSRAGLQPRHCPAMAGTSRQGGRGFRDATRLKPGYAEAYYEAGTILQQLGDWQASRGHVPPMADGDAGSMRAAELALARSCCSSASGRRKPNALLRQALQQPVPQEMRGILHKCLAWPCIAAKAKTRKRWRIMKNPRALNPGSDDRCRSARRSCKGSKRY